MKTLIERSKAKLKRSQRPPYDLFWTGPITPELKSVMIAAKKELNKERRA